MSSRYLCAVFWLSDLELVVNIKKIKEKEKIFIEIYTSNIKFYVSVYPLHPIFNFALSCNLSSFLINVFLDSTLVSPYFSHVINELNEVSFHNLRIIFNRIACLGPTFLISWTLQTFPGFVAFCILLDITHLNSPFFRCL